MIQTRRSNVEKNRNNKLSIERNLELYYNVNRKVTEFAREKGVRV